MDELEITHPNSILRSEKIALNYRGIKKRIEEICFQSQRRPHEVTLVAVTKNRGVEDITVLYDLGQRDFGESRWQEASEKIEFLPKDIRWHFLGPLQANKARVVGENFSVIHSLTNSRQLDEICKASKSIDGFVEVNIAKERQKAGVPVETLDEIVNIVVECKCVRFQGLMAIGPQTSNREVIRECFREIAVLNRRFQGKCLSMGMSEDFDVAIMEGSTHVRIGSALFSGV